MSDSTQEQQAEQKNPPFFRSIILIVLETIVSFLLKHDRMVRTYAKPFIKMHLSIQFNTFLPSDVFFITFTNKGILFDHAEPQHPKPAMMIYASSIDLIRILLTGSETSLQRLRMLGEEEMQEEFLLFLRSISLPHVASNFKHWLSKSEEERKEESPKRSVEPLLRRIEQQQATIGQLNLKVKEYEYDLKMMTKRNRRNHMIYLFLIVALSLSFLSVVWYYLI